MFNYLKQGIFDEMIQELSTMWQFENMTKKLQILELQKEKFAILNPDKEAWYVLMIPSLQIRASYC